MQRTDFGLPSQNHVSGTQYYRKAFNQLSAMNPDDFLIKEATFIIENAFYEEQKDYGEFNQVIKETGGFLRKKMDELGYDKNSNLAKNLILFQFFSDTLELKKENLKHLPFENDFEDIFGHKDWDKMFVSKLLSSHTGNCHSLPYLYKILAEEIGIVYHHKKEAAYSELLSRFKTEQPGNHEFHNRNCPSKDAGIST